MTQIPIHISNLIILHLWPAHARMMSEIRLNEVGKLGVDVERVGNLRHARSLFFLFFTLALPEFLLLGLTRGGAAVDGGGGAVGEERGFRGRCAVVGGEDGLACIAESAERTKVEFTQAVRVFLLVSHGDLRGATVNWRGSYAQRRRAAVDIGTGRSASSVLGSNGKGFVLRIIHGSNFGIFLKSHGTSRPNHAGSDVS